MTAEVDQRETLRLLVEASSAKLRRAVTGVPEELFGRRPGPGLNPIGFIYFHILRSWDEDLNALSQGRQPESDTWHRAGLSAELDYEPLGLGAGGRGVGVGFSDVEVDAVPKRPAVLSRYHDLLDRETGAYFDHVTLEDFDRVREAGPAHRHLGPYTPARLWGMVILHHAEHAGDIKFVKGMLGMPDPTYPGSRSKGGSA